MSLKIDCISDLHGSYPHLNGGDMLIIAGDMTARNRLDEWRQFADWVNKQPYESIVWIAGNHDGIVEYDWKWAKSLMPNTHYLQDGFVTLHGLKIYGSPWTPEFYNWHFMKKRGTELKAVWDKIPDDTDILITHGPPYGILDVPYKIAMSKHDKCGCQDLLEAVERVKPKLHVFGHIHGSYGLEISDKLSIDGLEGSVKRTIYVNASIMNEDYDPINKPIRIEL